MVDRGTQLDVSEEFEREKRAAGVNEQSGMSCSVITSLKSKNKDAQESPVLTTVRPHSRKPGLRNGETMASHSGR